MNCSEERASVIYIVTFDKYLSFHKYLLLSIIDLGVQLLKLGLFHCKKSWSEDCSKHVYHLLFLTNSW